MAADGIDINVLAEADGKVNLFVWADLLPDAMAFVDAERRCLWVNRGARELFGRTTLLSLRDGVLSAVDPDSAAQLAALVAGLAAEPASLVLSGGAVRERLVVHGRWVSQPDRPFAALTFKDPGRRTTIRLPSLQKVDGLTRSEQAIVERLLAGESPEEIAQTTGKSVLTVRTHIKRAYLKLGVATRAQLATRLGGYLTPAH